MSQRRLKDHLGRSATIFGAATTMTGRFFGDDDFIVYGKVEGDCCIRGTIVIQAKASWQGNIEAENAIISGVVEGDVLCRNKLEIAASARINGAVGGSTIAIAQGAVLEGEMRTTPQQDVNYFKERRKSFPASE